MVRLIGLLALAAPVFGARIAVTEDAAATALERGLAVLTRLKETPDDVNLQNEYGDLVGDVEFAENRIFLETGATTNQAPVLLGEIAGTGVVLTMAERTGFVESLGRWLTRRRDYVWEQEGGDSKYVLDGSTLSLHSRMHVFRAGEDNPRFILRRAFNYLNPLAHLFGQFVYRVIECTDARDGECSEGDILYTITKDRLGRGALWGMDEYRVYVGTGGCRRFGHGILGCDQESQVLYSLGAGLSEASFDTDFYKGNILAIHGSGEEATISENGFEQHIGFQELENMRIAHATKVEGPPRWLNWVSNAAGPIFGAGVQLARTLIWTDSYRLAFEGAGGAVDDLLVSLMVSAQDLTRDVISQHSVMGTVHSLGSTFGVGLEAGLVTAGGTPVGVSVGAGGEAAAAASAR